MTTSKATPDADATVMPEEDGRAPEWMAKARTSCGWVRALARPLFCPRLAGNQIPENAAMFSMRPIGYVTSPYKSPQEIPKGLGAKHEAEGVLEILPEFQLGLMDIEGFSHLFVIWVFDRSEGFELLGTPPSDNRPHGVFATRSPSRPNPIGLTVVELLRREDARLHVRGVDMLDRTPILDLKPYLSNVSAERLRRGWLEEAEARTKP